MANKAIRSRLGKKFGKGGGGGGGGGSATETASAAPQRNDPATKARATREARKARGDATGRPLERGNRVTRTQTTLTRKRQQFVRGTGSRTARIRRGVSGASVAGQSGGGSRSPRRTAPQTKKTQSSTEQRYRRMTSNLRRERREGRSGQFQAERLGRFTSSRGRD